MGAAAGTVEVGGAAAVDTKETTEVADTGAGGAESEGVVGMGGADVDGIAEAGVKGTDGWISGSLDCLISCFPLLRAEGMRLSIPGGPCGDASRVKEACCVEARATFACAAGRVSMPCSSPHPELSFLGIG